MQVDLDESLTVRYNELCRRAINFAENGAMYKETFREAMRVLDEGLKRVAIIKEKINKTRQQGSPKDSEVLQLNVNVSEELNLINNRRVLDPLPVKTKGRPPKHKLKSFLENTQKNDRKCTMCKASGHDKRNCPTLRSVLNTKNANQKEVALLVIS